MADPGLPIRDLHRRTGDGVAIRVGHNSNYGAIKNLADRDGGGDEGREQEQTTPYGLIHKSLHLALLKRS